jgi:RimJ/RimL family protein N-acetyltransferase
MDLADAGVFARATVEERTQLMKTGRIPVSPLVWEHALSGQPPAGPPDRIELTVALVKDDRVLGSVALLELDWINRSAETASYILFEDDRSLGYGTEAKMLLMEYAFDHLRLHVLNSWVRTTNTRSVAALMKQGFRPAGRKYWTGTKDGRYVDHLIFDVLREEWLAARDAWRERQASRTPSSAVSDDGS